MRHVVGRKLKAHQRLGLPNPGALLFIVNSVRLSTWDPDYSRPPKDPTYYYGHCMLVVGVIIDPPTRTCFGFFEQVRNKDCVELLLIGGDGVIMTTGSRDGNFMASYDVLYDP